MRFPHLFNQWRGEALSREEREIRDEVSFQARLSFLVYFQKSLARLKAYLVEFIEPLTEYPGTENKRWEHQKTKSKLALFCFNSFYDSIVNAKKPLTDLEAQDIGFW